MQILSNPGISEAIKKIKPTKIAVAFIGIDWKKYLSEDILDNLESIVISPTEGSNPDAIRDLADRIGWDKIHFQKRLHAKIYIGKDYAIVGSANLSFNGLSGDDQGLFEVCVKVETTYEINDIYNSILTEADRCYPTDESKKKAVVNLQKIWNKRVAVKLSSEKKREDSFEKFDIESYGNISLDWYDGTEDEPILKENSGLEDTTNSFKDWMYINPCDQVQENSWMLCWRRTSSKKMDGRIKPHWMYVHKIFNNVLDEEKNEGYSSLAVEYIKGKKPSKPFDENSNKFKKAFFSVINLDKYSDLRIRILDEDGNEMPFAINSNRLKDFFNDVKKEMTSMSKK